MAVPHATGSATRRATTRSARRRRARSRMRGRASRACSACAPATSSSPRAAPRPTTSPSRASRSARWPRAGAGTSSRRRSSTSRCSSPPTYLARVHGFAVDARARRRASAGVRSGCRRRGAARRHGARQLRLREQRGRHRAGRRRARRGRARARRPGAHRRRAGRRLAAAVGRRPRRRRDLARRAQARRPEGHRRARRARTHPARAAAARRRPGARPAQRHRERRRRRRRSRPRSSSPRPSGPRPPLASPRCATRSSRRCSPRCRRRALTGDPVHRLPGTASFTFAGHERRGGAARARAPRRRLLERFGVRGRQRRAVARAARDGHRRRRSRRPPCASRSRTRCSAPLDAVAERGRGIRRRRPDGLRTRVPAVESASDHRHRPPCHRHRAGPRRRAVRRGGARVAAGSRRCGTGPRSSSTTRRPTGPARSSSDAAARRRALPASCATRGSAGLGAARNTGLDLVETPFLGFLDADDALTPHGARATRRHPATRPAATSLVGAYVRLRPDGAGGYARGTRAAVGRPPRPHPSGAARRSTSTPRRSGNIVAWSKVSRTEFWQRSGLRFPEGRLYEDQIVAQQMYARARAAST